MPTRLEVMSVSLAAPSGFLGDHRPVLCTFWASLYPFIFTAPQLLF